MVSAKVERPQLTRTEGELGRCRRGLDGLLARFADSRA